MSTQLEEKINNKLVSNASPPNTAAQEMHSINRYKPNGQPLRVCFSTLEFPPDVGGISNSAKRITTFLKEAGFEVHVFAPIAEYPELFSRLKPVEIDGVYLYRIPVKDLHSDNPNFTRCHYLEDFSQFIWSIDQHVNFDIFHGFHLQMTYPCLSIANGRPVIASVRGIDAKAAFDPLYINESTKVLKQANWITSVSSESLRKLNQLVDISNYSGFLSNSIAKSKEAATWAITPKNKGCVGTVCTFRPKKNIPLLIKSYAQVNKHITKKLLLVGEFITSKLIDPNARKYSENLIDMLGIKAEVEITGLVEHERLASYYQSMNVFVISSDHEGLPNTLLEAAIHGVPIVATNIDGIKDIVIDGENGLLVPPGDSRAMSEAITRVLESPVLAKKLSRGAYQLAMKCSPDKEKQQWLDIYHRHLFSSSNDNAIA